LGAALEVGGADVAAKYHLGDFPHPLRLGFCSAPSLFALVGLNARPGEPGKG
jgi:hypothetical protein